MRVRSWRDSLAARFTPTPVGNACSASSRIRRRAVHPHACGECRSSVVMTLRSIGSPPRLWGMPAGAWQTKTPRPVHPHACGECLLGGSRLLDRDGSPPRLWGMRGAKQNADPVRRFTPTPVGNARQTQAPAARAAVHPHACGECCLLWSIPHAAHGSPPRLWGMLPFAGISRPARRFTPTPVGNALTCAQV